MKVTFRLSELGYGGTERVFLSVADHLSSTYGWSIDFVVDKVSGHETEHIAATKGYRVIDLCSQRTWKSIKPFRKYLRDAGTNVVISAYTETNAAALISSKFIDVVVPIIVSEHASLDEHWAGKPWLRRMMLEFIVRYVYKFADRAICVSRGMADQLAARLKRPVGYIHNPMRFKSCTFSKESSRKELGIGLDQTMILAVGRISVQKNYLMLLNALVELGENSTHHLFIVGGIFDQKEKARLDEFIIESNIKERVTFIDFTNSVEKYYKAADVFVLSSAWEGFGNVLIEALSFGLPIVSSNCNFGPAEILADGKYGLLVDVGDSSAMARALNQVLTCNTFNPDLQIQRASEFSEENIGQIYYQLICETTGLTI